MDQVLAGRERGWPRIDVSAERIIRTDVGFRPFRRSGFVVRAERLGDTLLVHNYGHGGAGITLSWGTADIAAEQVLSTGRPGSIAVLGCGVVGLATARLLQSHGREVTIYARDLPPATTSHVAGALWYPHLVVDEAHRTPAFDAQLERAARVSHQHFVTQLGADYGVAWRQQYFLSRTAVEHPWEHELLRDLFPASHRLAAAEHPFGTWHVLVDAMLFIEPPIYLPALLRDFRTAGGQLHVRAIRTVAEVTALPEPIVVNCTGLGARELFGDRELTAVKGQLSVLPPQPGVDFALLTDSDLYMFPRQDGILLGGTHEAGVETPEPNREAERQVLAGHKAIFDAASSTVRQ